MKQKEEYTTMLPEWNVQHRKITLLAMCWLDRRHKYFLSTVSISIRTSEQGRVRWQELSNGLDRRVVSVSLTLMVGIYYDGCAKIDQHNRCRQDNVDIEKKI